MRKPTAAAGTLLAATLLLTGCVGDLLPKPPQEQTAPSNVPEEVDETDTTGPIGSSFDVEAAIGEELVGTGYTVRVPEGWAVPETMPPGFDPDALAADMTDADGFADNVNVILSPAGLVSADIIEASSEKELVGSGAEDVVVLDRELVDGSEATHISALFSAQGLSYLIEQYAFSTADQTYLVTFSFSDTVSVADRMAVTESVLASWAWND